VRGVVREERGGERGVCMVVCQVCARGGERGKGERVRTSVQGRAREGAVRKGYRRYGCKLVCLAAISPHLHPADQNFEPAKPHELRKMARVNLVVGYRD
jgi:hypothetical protein